MVRLITLFTIVGLSCVVAACNKQAPELATAMPLSADLDQVRDQEYVLATVNGSRIGADDLSINMARTLGDSLLQYSDPSVEGKILQAMVASRAIALKALQEIPADDQVMIEKRVAQFREELLVKEYLMNNVSPELISSQQIAEYYANNPDEFSGQKIRQYELITVSGEAYQQDSKAAVAAVSLAKTHDDWQELSKQTKLSDGEVSVSHSFQELVGEAPQGPLEEALLALDDGQVSRMIFSNGAPYLLRLINTNQQKAVPLEQARASIRRTLLPSTVRQSVRTLSEQVVSESDVILSVSAE